MRLHHPHARDRRSRRLRRRVHGHAPRRVLERARAHARPAARLRAAAPRRPLGALRHDAARDALRALGERREPAPRRGLPRAVPRLLARARAGRGADPSRHQRHPRPDLGGAGRTHAARRTTSAPTGNRASTTRALATRIDAIPDAELWEMRNQLRRYLVAAVRARAHEQPRRATARIPTSSPPPTTCSIPTCSPSASRAAWRPTSG